MGERDLDPGRRIFDGDAESLHLRTRDPHAALKELFARDRQHVFLEGGPTLAAAFLQAGLVDEVVTYVAPMLLGAGRNAVGDLGITTIADALHLRVEDVTVLDDNVRLTDASPTTAKGRTDMFTGIIEELGSVEAIEDQGDAVRLSVRGPLVVSDAGDGDSIAVNGCCLTVVEPRRRGLHRRRDAGDPRQDLARCASGPAPGSTSSARSPRRSGSAGTSSRATSTAPARSAPAPPASTGRSSRSACPTGWAATWSTRARSPSTASRSPSSTVTDDSFTVSLIPETLARTTLGIKQPGEPVNLEVDVIAKHVEKLVRAYTKEQS